MKSIASSAVLCLLAVLCGAGCQTVHVQDATGEPLFMAEVKVVDNSDGNFSIPAFTDLFGNAVLPMEWDDEALSRQLVEASKDGYTTKKVRRGEGQVTISLNPAANAPRN